MPQARRRELYQLEPIQALEEIEHFQYTATRAGSMPM